MRRFRRPAALACLLAGVLSGCSAVAEAPVVTAPVVTQAASATPSADTVGPSQSPETEQRCLALAGTLSAAELAGQVLMVGVGGSLDASERSAIRRSKAGSVILMGGSGDRTATRRLTRSLQSLGGDTAILVAVDQEGGLVQRLKGKGFATIPSATAQSALGADGLAAKAVTWGKQLAGAGVHLNLAPVADVVPKKYSSTNQPVARLKRGYGTEPDQVADLVTAAVTGWQQAGVSTAVKHFPGLGAVRGNTDHAATVTDSTTTVDSALLEPFRAAVEAGTDAVMVSSASYARIDSKRIAAFSPKIIEILREWGFDGVVVSDDLGAAKALSEVPVKQRAVRFVAAGGDLAITVPPGQAKAMASGLVARAGEDEAFAAKLAAAAARVLALKERHGLVDCG